MIRIITLALLLVAGYCVAEECVPHVTIDMPMRDGVKLPTDIYLPDPEARNLPCILIRAPNGRRTYAHVLAPMAASGYAVAIQDTRNLLDAEGRTFPYLSDGWGVQQDGYDAVQWLANSPYTNGKIGTYGVSAQGITQLLMAPSRPPNLTCQHIGIAASSLFEQGIFAGGQLRKHQVESWLGYYAPHPTVLAEVAKQHRYNDVWAELDTVSVAHRVDAPAIHHGGWYDIFIQGTIDAFVSRQERGGKGARGKQKLVIGPWTHFWPEEQRLGDFKVPEAGQQVPVDYSAMRWFDYYLKGIDNGIANLPSVTYYVMGPFDGSPSSGNVWRYADSWPPPSALTPFYLAPGGKLLADKAAPLESLSYYHDPANPVPTIGGNNLFLASGPMDQRPIEERDDVVVFTTEPLTQDLEVTGRVLAQILLGTDQDDTDIVVRLCDVYPDGRSILIADGIQRLSDAAPLDRRIGCNKGPRRLDIDLWSTSIVFAKGHRIRISISSSNFPRYDIATNRHRSDTSEAPHPIAENTLFFGGVRGSRILLPVIKR